MSRLMFVFAVVFCCVSIATGQAGPPGDARFDEGQNKAASGDVRGALAVYASLTQTYPDSYEAHARLGGMQLMDQRYADAVKSFQQAITHGDKGTRSFIGMGMAYLHMGQFGPARGAFVEAQARGAGERPDIAGIITWIDSRDSAPTAHQVPR
jgi:Flp pilus assembly protein TadD